MITTGSGEIAVVTGAAVADQRDTGSDVSVFAQLLGDAAASVPAAGATNGKAGGRKPVNTRTETGAALLAPPSADLLALCGLPVTLSASEVAMTDKAADASADASANVIADPADPSAQALTAGIDPTAVMVLPQTVATQINTQIDTQSATQGSTQSTTQSDARGDTQTTAQINRQVETTATGVLLQNSDLADASRAADLQWLSGGVRGDTTRSAVIEEPKIYSVVQTQIKSAASLSAAPASLSSEQIVRQSVQQGAQQPAPQLAESPSTQTMTDTAGAIELPVLQDSATVTPEQQAAFQKLLAQTTPMMGVMTAQLREADVDESVRTTSSDMLNFLGAVNASALQPPGTQLAGDVPVLEISPRHHLQSPVGTQQWATELGNRLTMMATKDTQSATLYMTPADLGPVQVRIDLNQDQASVWFTAEHAETRSALEQSLPKLREMFSAQGMSLTDAGVFGDRSRQQQADSGFTSAGFHSSQYDDSETLADTATVRSISLGLLDAYA